MMTVMVTMAMIMTTTMIVLCPGFTFSISFNYYMILWDNKIIPLFRLPTLPLNRAIRLGLVARNYCGQYFNPKALVKCQIPGRCLGSQLSWGTCDILDPLRSFQHPFLFLRKGQIQQAELNSSDIIRPVGSASGSPDSNPSLLCDCSSLEWDFQSVSLFICETGIISPSKVGGQIKEGKWRKRAHNKITGTKREPRRKQNTVPNAELCTDLTEPLCQLERDSLLIYRCRITKEMLIMSHFTTTD